MPADTLLHDQANVMKIFHGGKIIIGLCQTAVQSKKEYT